MIYNPVVNLARLATASQDSRGKSLFQSGTMIGGDEGGAKLVEIAGSAAGSVRLAGCYPTNILVGNITRAMEGEALWRSPVYGHSVGPFWPGPLLPGYGSNREHYPARAQARLFSAETFTGVRTRCERFLCGRSGRTFRSAALEEQNGNGLPI